MIATCDLPTCTWVSYSVVLVKTEIHFSTDPSLLVIKLELKQKHKIRTRNITKTKSKAHEPN